MFIDNLQRHTGGALTDDGARMTTAHAPELDPRLAGILARSLPLASLDVASMRSHALADKAPWNDGAADGLEVTDSSFATPAGPRPLRIVAPRGAQGELVVFIHGGGWSICDLDTHLSVFAGLARTAGRTVLAPHARRAPEHPFPAALDDTCAALRMAGRRYPGGVALAGDSAGANLALAALLALRAAGESPPVSAVVAFYGCYRRRFDTASHRACGDGRFGLSTAKMERFWTLYCGGATPALADLSGQSFTGLPPIQLHAAEADPLLDDTLWLNETLTAQGGRCELVRWPGMTHGFLHYHRDLPQARDALARAAAFLDAHGAAQ